MQKQDQIQSKIKIIELILIRTQDKQIVIGSKPSNRLFLPINLKTNLLNINIHSIKILQFQINWSQIKLRFISLFSLHQIVFKFILLALMSIKDKINFWQQKKVVGEVKPFPKPSPFQNKKPIVIPPSILSSKESQQSIKINLPEKLQHQRPINQINPKKVDVINLKKPQQTVHQPTIKAQLTEKIKKQQNPAQNQDKIISVKANINKFNNLPIPILGQNAQSCILGSFKKPEAPKKQGQNQKKNEPQTILAHSTPLYEVVTTEQHRLTLKQKILMTQKALANRNGQLLAQKKKVDEPKQNKQTQENQKQSSNQQNGANQDDCQKRDQKEKRENQQSDRLFQESMKEQTQKPTLLVGSQTNNLTLQTRMTRKPRTKNEQDDFDDL